jgi:hypothetical protein
MRPENPPSRSRARLLALLALALATALLSLGTGSAASASSGTATAPTGWIRVGHISPDTPAVDVYIAAYSGGQAHVIKDAPYGTVTPYTALNPGLYTVAMRAENAAATSAPMLSWTVNVQAGSASTLLAVDDHGRLTPSIIPDDLTAPAGGDAKIRLIQGAADSTTVSASVVGGPQLADDAAYGTATGYGQIPAGTWTIKLTGTGHTALTTRVTVIAGSVTSLLILDHPGGGLELTPILDASSMTRMPAGGVQTGAGGTAPPPPGAGDSVPPYAYALAALLLAAAALAWSRRRAFGPKATR